MDQTRISTFEESFRRCDANPRFLDLFYDNFLASSSKVRARFANTDFQRQKRVLRASFYLILLASEDETHGPERYLGHLAARHSARDLNIGAQLYDLWLDSLLKTVKECDPEYSDDVESAWEEMMGIGIRYLLEHYHDS